MLTEQNRQEDCQFKLVNNIDILCKLKFFHDDDTDDSIHRYCPYLCATLIWEKREDVDTQDQLCYIMLQ